MAVTLVVGYVFIQFAANVTVLKSVSLVADYSIPVGSLLFAVSYTWIDLINEHFGNRRAHWLVFVTVASNALLILWLKLFIALPGNPQWRADPANQAAIEFVLGSIPRVVIASLSVNLLIENTDIAIYHLVRTRLPRFPLWGRSIVSNTVSAPLDGVLFPLAALAGTMPHSVLIKIIITSSLYKLGVAYVSVPLLYLIRARRSASRA